MSNSLSTTFLPQFTASGLISGLDTGNMVTQLTQLAALPVTSMTTQQTAIKSQISAEATLSSQLSALGALSNTLSDTGIVSANAQTSSQAFTAVAGVGAAPGRYTLQVGQLAAPANDRSQSFDNASSPVSAGTLSFSVGGKTATVTITDGMQLADVAKAINHSGLRISANVLATGTAAYLSITTLDEGFDPHGVAASALQVTETADPTSTQGHPLSLASITTAQNAQFTLDGLDFTRQNNTVTDALNGVTLNLTAQSNTAEALVVTTDPAASQATLQSFVDTYNTLITSLNAQIAPGAGADSTVLLSGNSAVRSLQQALQSMTSATTGATGSVQSLADIGIKTSFTDGTISIDTATFTKALAANPQGIKDLFATASTGVNAQVQAVVKRYTNPIDGLFVNDTQGMNDTVTQMTSTIATLQLAVDGYHDRLAQSFANMETLLSNMKTNASYLTQAFDAINPPSSK
jgi:flagellar hook-associated protein 2